MTDAIRYHRFSSKKQDRGSSLERQDTATRALCERKGWTIVETLEDKGQSAWKGDHLSVGELGKLRQRIDAGAVERGTVIVVENLDRLSRQDYRTARRWIEDVTDAGIVVAVCTPELWLDAAAMDGSNIGAILQHLLEANRATGESKRKSDFQRGNIERMRNQARAGVVYSPTLPAWLEGETGGKITINEERADVVRMIYEWSASDMGAQSICKRLNATVKPWTQPGWKTGKAEWRIGYVRDILTTAAVEGEYWVKGADRKPTGEVIRGYYPRIVDAELVERARAAMARRSGTGGQNRQEAANLFAGVLICDECEGPSGRIVTGNGRGGTYPYVRCRSSRYGTCENRSAIRYDILENSVMNAVLHLALDDTHFVRVDDVAPLAGRVSTLKKRVEELQHDQANLLAVLRKRPDSEALMGELDKIEADLSSVRAELRDAEGELDRARGNVSPDEHLKRVHEVRNSINADDPETRTQARRKVRDAFSSVISSVRCKASGEALVTLAGGLVQFVVKSDGALAGANIEETFSALDFAAMREDRDVRRRLGLPKADQSRR